MSTACVQVLTWTRNVSPNLSILDLISWREGKMNKRCSMTTQTLNFERESTKGSSSDGIISSFMTCLVPDDVSFTF